jgi:hypothetical protein
LKNDFLKILKKRQKPSVNRGFFHPTEDHSVQLRTAQNSGNFRRYGYHSTRNELKPTNPVSERSIVKMTFGPMGWLAGSGEV